MANGSCEKLMLEDPQGHTHALACPSCYCWIAELASAEKLVHALLNVWYLGSFFLSLSLSFSVSIVKETNS